jgi:hypothetical protein
MLSSNFAGSGQHFASYSGSQILASFLKLVRLIYIVTHMTPARQRIGKHVPEVTLSTTEGHLKAGIVKSE